MTEPHQRRAGHELNHRQRYATTDEVDWLRTVAATLPEDAMVVILGAGPGIMAAAVKDGAPEVNLLIVDNVTCMYALAHLSSFGEDYTRNVLTVTDDSSRAGMKYGGPSIQLLIVDADHTEAGVASDILSWWEHLVEGGLALFHDYDASGTWFEGQEQYPGVKAAVKRFFSRYDELERVGTSIVVRKDSARDTGRFRPS